jgi:predicted phage replisome organizer
MIKMRERRNVKFKLDIYDDTKTKIIDQRPERDFIHYFFARSIILAGKSDSEGELYMAKDIPYTIETLAIEFCRDAELVKVALDVLIELKMIEVIEDNIYKVKSFAKHQNIKTKVEAKENGKEGINVRENNTEIYTKYRSDIGTSNNQVEMKGDRLLEDNLKDKIQEETYNRKNQDESIGVTVEHENNEINCNNIRNADIAPSSIEQGWIDAGQDIEITSVNTECEEDISVNPELRSPNNCLSGSSNQQNIESNSEQSNLINLEMKENKKFKKKKNESNLITELAADQIEDDSPIFFFYRWRYAAA